MIVKVGSGLLVVGSLWQNNHLTSNGQEDNHASTKGDFHKETFQLQFCNRRGVSGLVSSSLHQVVLRDLARIHSEYLCKTEWLSSQSWLERREGHRMAVTAELWQAMLDHAKTEFPEIWTEERYVCVVWCMCVGWEECLCVVCQVDALDGWRYTCR